METKVEMNFAVDKENKKITVEREYAAPLSKVWAAWTQDEMLDQWWAPKPWKAETKLFEFTEGGTWLYAMVGPKGEKQWSVEKYNSINPQKSFSYEDGFSDENGNVDTSKPRAYWTNYFTEDSGITTVTIDIKFDSEAALEELLKTGFKEGFTMGLQNLEELLKSNN
jgi:uncharacterized protein YndB with AHSA1/START domain